MRFRASFQVARQYRATDGVCGFTWQRVRRPASWDVEDERATDMTSAGKAGACGYDNERCAETNASDVNDTL